MGRNIVIYIKTALAQRLKIVTRLNMFASRILRVLGVVGNVSAATWIVPGAVWKDTAGNTIDAHGGGIVERSGTYYWTGQSASNSASIS